MEHRPDELEGLVAEIVARYVAQNGGTPPPEQALRGFASRLRAVVAERGLPPPLAPGERKSAGSKPEDETGPLVARVLAGSGDELLADGVKQLVKACFYPEFTECRDSFRETKRDGSCKRQNLERVRGRASGTHCVDCPYWVSLSPERHVEFVASEWKAGPETFMAHRDIFLPEDFRRLRQWLYRAARLQIGGGNP
ncbi:MAG: hypothetical protein V4773_13370 [Verrucomicrobiota bacterium]